MLTVGVFCLPLSELALLAFNWRKIDGPLQYQLAEFEMGAMEAIYRDNDLGIMNTHTLTEGLPAGPTGAWAALTGKIFLKQGW